MWVVHSLISGDIVSYDYRVQRFKVEDRLI